MGEAKRYQIVQILDWSFTEAGNPLILAHDNETGGDFLVLGSATMSDWKISYLNQQEQ